MTYSISQLAQLSGVSTRTLRYYDECGLLVPKRVSGNSYRVYGKAEVDLLQQILFYRELGVALDDIKQLILSDSFDGQATLERHLSSLLKKRKQLDLLIHNVEKTISTAKGETKMRDAEKFEGFKQKLLEENEQKYGKEIRNAYGVEALHKSNAKLQKMTQAQYTETEALSEEINHLLKKAFEEGDPAGETAQRMCGLHQQWLSFFWAHYSKEAHTVLAQSYVDDPRFTAYYDKIAVGCAAFLRDAIHIFCS